MGLLAIEHLQPTHGRTAAYDALITSASSSTRACSPSSEHNPPTHLVATMPSLVTRHHSFEHESEGTDTAALSCNKGP